MAPDKAGAEPNVLMVIGGGAPALMQLQVMLREEAPRTRRRKEGASTRSQREGTRRAKL